MFFPLLLDLILICEAMQFVTHVLKKNVETSWKKDREVTQFCPKKVIRVTLIKSFCLLFALNYEFM